MWGRGSAAGLALLLDPAGGSTGCGEGQGGAAGGCGEEPLPNKLFYPPPIFLSRSKYEEDRR